MVYSFTPEEMQQVIDFSNKIDCSFYKQKNPEKLRQYQITGKLAELVAYHYLRGKNYPVSYPDFAIYDVPNKSWAPDLFDGKNAFSVKGQELSEAKKWGWTWTFSTSDKSLEKDGYVVLVGVDTPMKMGSIKAIVSMRWLKENELFRQPQLSKYIGDKIVIYLNEIQEKTNGKHSRIV